MTAHAPPPYGGKIPIAIDFETHLISAEQPLPPVVCVSLAERNENGQIETSLLGNDKPEVMETLLRSLLEDDTILLVAASASYDMGVICRSFPALLPLVFRAYENERVHCTKIRERLLDISDHGSTGKLPLPDGSFRDIKYSLADLTLRYLGINRFALKEQKEGGADIWRLNYHTLDGVPAEQYPPEAAEYARNDASDCLGVWYAQEERKRGETGPCSMATQELRAAQDFALSLLTEHGMAIDPARVAEIEAELDKITSDENLQILYTSGILRPAEPPRPKRTKAPEIEWHVEDMPIILRRELVAAACEEIGLKPELGGRNNDKVQASLTALTRLYLSAVELFESEGVPLPLSPSARLALPNFAALADRAELTEPPGEPAMTQGKKASVNRKALSELVHSLRVSHGLPPVWTASSEGKDEEEKNHSTAEEVVEEVAHLSPVLKKYLERNSITKILTTELPRMRNPDGSTAPVVRFNYGLPIDTGRTSSFAGKSYPSANGQNILPAVRPCYVPRPGHLLASIDYSSIELVSAAETCLRLFGHSKLADIILAGKDPHGYLGSALATRLEPRFGELCRASCLSSLDDCFTAFERCKTSETKELRDFYKKYRLLAKPTGLGYPGGLGAQRFVGYAKSDFGVEVTEEEAKMLKELWLETYPEFRDYFKWVQSSLKDPSHPIIGYDDFGKPKEGFAYATPLGMWRARCKYTEVCNGFALQSPTADGAAIAIWNVVRACHDPSVGNSALFGCRPVNFLHDEILLELPDDAYAHDRAIEAARIMVESMRVVFQTLPVKAEPALMRRWYKEADSVYDSAGRLIPWEPNF